MVMAEEKEQLVNAPMTRKEFLSLPIELRRTILKRQADLFVKRKK
jgi:hypothetical protein